MFSWGLGCPVSDLKQDSVSVQVPSTLAVAAAPCCIATSEKTLLLDAFWHCCSLLFALLPCFFISHSFLNKKEMQDMLLYHYHYYNNLF